MTPTGRAFVGWICHCLVLVKPTVSLNTMTKISLISWYRAFVGWICHCLVLVKPTVSINTMTKNISHILIHSQRRKFTYTYNKTQISTMLNMKVHPIIFQRKSKGICPVSKVCCFPDSNFLNTKVWFSLIRPLRI